MTSNAKVLVAGVALAASLIAVTPASATVVTFFVTGGAGPHGDIFSPTDPIGTLPAHFLNEPVADNITYDFLFQLTGIAPGDTTQIQVQAQAQATGAAELISFNLFSGSPGATPSVGGTPSSLSTNAELITSLGDGSYFIQITPAQIAAAGEANSGSVVENLVPEPAAWSLMLLGFGGVGAALRRRQVKPASISA